jgi:hypothetical protein
LIRAYSVGLPERPVEGDVGFCRFSDGTVMVAGFREEWASYDWGFEARIAAEPRPDWSPLTPEERAMLNYVFAALGQSEKRSHDLAITAFNA